MSMGGPPPGAYPRPPMGVAMGPPGLYPHAQWQPGMPGPDMAPGGMVPGMPPGWARGMEAWHQGQNPRVMQGGGPPKGMPGPPEPPAVKPPSWVAIWNVDSQTDEDALCGELDQIDFLPETNIKVKDLGGAFLLGYRDYPFLADAICVALDKTTEFVKGNGEPLRVAKCNKEDELPPEIARNLHLCSK